MVMLKGLNGFFFMYTMRCDLKIIINFGDMVADKCIFEDFTTEARTVSCLNFDCFKSYEMLLCSYLKSKLF